MNDHPRDSAATRDRILNAYQELIIDHGERAATLDAVARDAEVSKGGLLYHFPSKAALTEGMLDRLDRMVDEDIATIRTAPDGAVAYFLRSSIVTDSSYDYAIAATMRLAQLPDAQAAEAVERMRRRWLDVLTEATGDTDLATLVAVAADGLYSLASTGVTVTETELAPVLRALGRAGASVARSGD
ncbi:TetR/AcrR family transcriptional regulator [Mycetocola reblochoni]|uniref:Transcriptional regulator, TetR family n=1 Tax=Mycetocola reblochoni REB411 TaxID=1255698 RepID=A0A1R4JAL4_9MICO|nr:TetR/AcrR family transcriptional regulator [Mycetocola reblochoni]SJN29062.1 Transcriptional regulator, TetR family [Mycetocola reblochoni REB411]